MKTQRRFTWRFWLISTLILLVFLFAKKNNIVRWVQSGITTHRQEKTIKQYRKDIQEIDTQLEMLSSNVDTLETFAREKFYFSKPGDDVYVIPENR